MARHRSSAVLSWPWSQRGSDMDLLEGLLLAGLPPSGIRPIRRDKKGDVVRWKGAIGDDDAWCKSGLPGQIRGRYQRD